LNLFVSLISKLRTHRDYGKVTRTRAQTLLDAPPFPAINTPACLEMRESRGEMEVDESRVILDEYDTLESQPQASIKDSTILPPFSAMNSPAHLDLWRNREVDGSFVVFNEYDTLESQPHTSIEESQTSPVSSPFSAMSSPVLERRGNIEVDRSHVILDEYDNLESQPPCNEPSIIYGKLVITVTDTGAGLSESNQVFICTYFGFFCYSLQFTV
jgi:hypothetical protein